LARRADIVVLGVRPQDILSLTGPRFRGDALVVSCIAGLPGGLLRRVLGVDVRRIMCSGPDSISDGMGIATMYPALDKVRRLLAAMGLDVLDVSSEEELDSFTVGICVPALLLNSGVPMEEAISSMARVERTHPVYGALRRWVESVTPERSAVNGGRYLDNVCTKGGVTEAMMALLGKGASFEDALNGGMARGRQITDDIRRKIETYQTCRIYRSENQPALQARLA
jgi:pyrroline-5-carboxylate reductase